MSKKVAVAPPPCPVCGYKPKPGLPAGENALWQCSHIDCPNRHPVTAQPSERRPKNTL